ncbi:MAG: phosphoribosyl-ATP diphosphatase [Alphaproteobacteria bacterium]|jgi:phosphoribosyl-ATP pyrophosphohydrolase|nr:phosphoribosyl-ATP diphosphatase [Alphaproteobacteria bacterium]MDP6516045.1 phosphoribosyl-ATP diphosphatase [Alphaproteobacteria bacterium]
MASAAAAGAEVLDRLFEVIESRRGGDPARSYVARRLDQGTGKIAQKLGEEAVECVIAAIAGDRRAVIGESADLLFHLMILWADAGIAPGEVYGELARREGVSGLDEKRARHVTGDE